MVYRTIWQNLKAWSDHEQEPATFAPLAVVFPQDIQFFSVFVVPATKVGWSTTSSMTLDKASTPKARCVMCIHIRVYTCKQVELELQKNGWRLLFFIFRNSGLETYKEKGSFGWNMLRDGSKHRWSSTQSGHAKPENSWVVTILGSREKTFVVCQTDDVNPI